LKPTRSGKPFGEPSLVLVIVEVRCVKQEPSLLAQHLCNLRMGVPERIHTDAADQVKVPVSLEIVNVATLTAVKSQWVARVVLKQVLRFKCFYLIERGQDLRLRSCNGCHLLIIESAFPGESTFDRSLFHNVVEIHQSVAIIDVEPEHGKHRQTQDARHAHLLMPR
jgi:hypothetical protein